MRKFKDKIKDFIMYFDFGAILLSFETIVYLVIGRVQGWDFLVMASKYELMLMAIFTVFLLALLIFYKINKDDDNGMTRALLYSIFVYILPSVIMCIIALIIGVMRK